MPKTISIKVKLLPHGEGLPLPQYMTAHAAGMDVVAAVQSDFILKSGECKLVPTGLQLEIPEGYEVQIRPRSGLALKNQITLLNSPGTIDADYRGEVGVIMMNLGKNDFVIKRGDRIAQAVVAEVIQAKLEIVEAVSATARGAGGFGSTGV
jgi:dUTP pyrophosphatase